MIRLVLLLLVLVPCAVVAQTGSINGFTGDETVFYAQTKQMNQFFRRFNGEEDIMGKRYYAKDSQYRDPKARKKFLGILFDNSNPLIGTDEKNSFIGEVVSKQAPVFLDFHGKDWFAEVNATFLYKKEKANLILYLKLEKQDSGYKWVFSNVYFNRFEQYFDHLNDTAGNGLFLHPLSHEVDFMNFHKIFKNEANIDYYLEDPYVPDQMALFVMEIKNGNLKFETVGGVKFHFFQVPGWYFEVSYFNRNNVNSGWLISNLIRISEKDKKSLIRNYTHEK
jgi:hypothetical protein